VEVRPVKAPHVIEHLGRKIAEAPPGFPVHVLVTLRPPEMLQIAFIALYGNETFVLAFESEDHAEQVLRDGHESVNNGRPLLQVSRLISARTISGGTREWSRER
jgi:hypothetical protein